MVSNTGGRAAVFVFDRIPVQPASVGPLPTATRLLFSPLGFTENGE